MQKEFFLKYQNKKVKIQLKDGFGIKGTITDIFEDCFEFTTFQGTSIIVFDQVTVLMEVNWWKKEIE